jgi:hypothetical protein
MKRVTILGWIYGAIVAGTLAIYGGSVFLGWQFRTAEASRLPPDVRSSGSYRSFHFWHSGYQGGK